MEILWSLEVCWVFKSIYKGTPGLKSENSVVFFCIYGFMLFFYLKCLFFLFILVDVGRIPLNWITPKSTEQKLYEYLFEGYQVRIECLECICIMM